nr:MAG TPA: hypothetical protein [Caudoviricetes sp.]
MNRKFKFHVIKSKKPRLVCRGLSHSPFLSLCLPIFYRKST